MGLVDLMLSQHLDLAKYKNAPFARKIDDRILIQSIVGKEFTKNLSFSAFFNFTSQIGNGYKYTKKILKIMK